MGYNYNDQGPVSDYDVAQFREQLRRGEKMSTRNQRRIAKKKNREQFENLPVELSELPREKWPGNVGLTKGLTRLFMSRQYIVQLFSEEDGPTRLSVEVARFPKKEDDNDCIPWTDLQEIKRLVGFGDNVAVEIFPKEIDVVFETSMRHLWILPEGLPKDIGWLLFDSEVDS